MIGITKISSGRMGNRLFHYHFLRQLSNKINIDYFSIKFPETKYFKRMEKKKRPFSFFQKNIKLKASKIRKMSPIQLFNFIKEKNKNGYDIILHPPILGEFFFDYLFTSPNKFLIVKPKYRKNFDFKINNRVIVGIHFRGSDFKNWNKQASLKINYYKKAINYCQQIYNGKLIFILFTDDIKFHTYLETINYLENNNFKFYLSNNLKQPIIDFYQLSQCDVIISSPSTFAIIAGATGKTKKIIHSQEWLDYSISRNDKFWIDLKNTKNPHYSLWKIC